MTSEARIEANRRNAKKSTGPRTAEGKARARMNALTHGLRAEQVVLPTEDPKEFEAHLGRWMADWKPPTETRRFLVERVAVASWRLERCVRVETGRLSDRAEGALAKWDHSRAVVNDRAETLFAIDPAEAIARLEQTRSGILRLIQRWAGIEQAFTDPSGWTDEVEHHQRLVHMMGYSLNDGTDEVRYLIDVSRQMLLRNRPELAEPGESAMSDANHAALATTFHAVFVSKFNILQDIFEGLPDESAARTRYAELEAFAPLAEDAPFHRYEAQHDREARSVIAMLIKLEKTGEDLVGVRLEEAEAELPNEPKPVEATKARSPELPNEPKPARASKPRSPEAPNEPIAALAVVPVVQADRDRDGRLWPIAECPAMPDDTRSA